MSEQVKSERHPSMDNLIRMNDKEIEMKTEDTIISDGNWSNSFVFDMIAARAKLVEMGFHNDDGYKLYLNSKLMDFLNLKMFDPIHDVKGTTYKSKIMDGLNAEIFIDDYLDDTTAYMVSELKEYTVKGKVFIEKIEISSD